MKYMIGVDVGGTFTDFSVFEQESGRLFHFKHSSTNYDSSVAIVNGILEVLNMEHATAQQVVYLAHGTTVSTNALIEKKGAKVGVITTEGFNDIMEIGIQKRPFMYDTLGQKPEPLIMSGMNRGVPERIAHDGSVVTPLDEEAVRKLVAYFKANGVNSIAVSTLFSFINPAHEKRIKEIIAAEYPGVYTTISSELVPEFREYSRMSTTVLNAYLGPVMKDYVNNFQNSVKNIGIQVEPYVTQSNGSIISIKETIECPIKTAVSGPSAGVIAAANIGRQCGADKIITFDMGGTSADISLIENYEPQVSNERLVEGYPARIPMINIITIGAGGGSIAKIDAGGMMKVGPESAGATPGPACYGRGGELPTVTDANIYLGKLNQQKILGGRMDVYLDKAETAIQTHLCAKTHLSMDEAANGIISVVNSNMMRAIRVVSVEKGYDVREFSLMAFGGAGPLHACEVSQELGIRSVLIPPSPGTLCSLGLLMADTKFDFCRTKIMNATAESIPEANEIFRQLVAEGDAMLTTARSPGRLICATTGRTTKLPSPCRIPFSTSRPSRRLSRTSTLRTSGPMATAIRTERSNLSTSASRPLASLKSHSSRNIRSIRTPKHRSLLPSATCSSRGRPNGSARASITAMTSCPVQSWTARPFWSRWTQPSLFRRTGASKPTAL